MQIPPYVIRAIEKLESEGYSAYLVGGCLRDTIIGTPVNDWDITCSALPDAVLTVFDGCRIVAVGIQHGTLRIEFTEGSLEVTSFRRDGEYYDNRHPATIEFVKTIEDDLSRRDFTMNAIAFNPQAGFIDPFGGQGDISDRLIRSVGDPCHRLQEDALRIMRALRFSSTLGFTLEDDLSRSLHVNKELLARIATERVSIELLKMLAGAHVLPVLLEYADVLAVFIPEIEATIGFDQKSRFHQYDIWEHTARAVDAARQDQTVRLALLMHDLGKPARFFIDSGGEGHFYGHDILGEELARNRLRELRFSNALVHQVSQVIRFHQVRLKAENTRKWLARLGEELLRLLIEVKRGDIAAHSDLIRELAMSDLMASEARLNEIIDKRLCVRLSDLAINGNDLLKMGLKEGRMIGEILSFLLTAVIEERLENSKETLLTAAMDYSNDWSQRGDSNP